MMGVGYNLLCCIRYIYIICLFHDIQSVPIIYTILSPLYPHPNWSLSNPLFKNAMELQELHQLQQLLLEPWAESDEAPA